MDLGGKASRMRTAEQTDIARFWGVVGPASWDPLLRAVASAPGRTLLQNARLFALAEMAAADAYIAVFDAKYTYNFWRPITAIRNGDQHGGASAMVRVADWIPPREGRAQLDPARRAAAYEAAQQLVLDDVPSVYLFHEPAVDAWSPRVRGYRPHPMWATEIAEVSVV